MNKHESWMKIFSSLLGMILSYIKKQAWCDNFFSNKNGFVSICLLFRKIWPSSSYFIVNESKFIDEILEETNIDKQHLLYFLIICIFVSLFPPFFTWDISSRVQESCMAMSLWDGFGLIPSLDYPYQMCYMMILRTVLILILWNLH